MAEGEYNVVFRGVLTGAKSEDEVKVELSALFNASADRIEALFSGKPIVVKRNVDAVTATKFRNAFQQAGAVCELVPASGDQAGGSDETDSETSAEAAEAPSKQDSDTGAAGSAAAASTETQARADAVDIAGDPNQTVVERSISEDLSHLSIDESDAPHQPHQQPPPPQVNLEGLSLVEDDKPLSQRPKEAERQFDTSGMSLAPQESSSPRPADSAGDDT